jgi:hypothetical protein
MRFFPFALAQGQNDKIRSSGDVLSEGPQLEKWDSLVANAPSEAVLSEAKECHPFCHLFLPVTLFYMSP